MSKKESIEELTEQLLRIHIDRKNLTAQERVILQRPARLDKGKIRSVKPEISIKREEDLKEPNREDRY